MYHTKTMLGQNSGGIEWTVGLVSGLDMMTSSNGNIFRVTGWAFVGGIHWSLVNSHHKGQWCGALMFSLICAWINDWVNNCEVGGLRCHHAHYYVTVIIGQKLWWNHSLTHWGRVTYMCQQTNQHWFRQWLVAWPVPNHYLNQCWNIVNWTLRNKLLCIWKCNLENGSHFVAASVC